MKTKKKRFWRVTLELNMFSGYTKTYIVEAFKREQAIERAEKECKKEKNFYCYPVACEEL